MSLVEELKEYQDLCYKSGRDEAGMLIGRALTWLEWRDASQEPPEQGVYIVRLNDGFITSGYYDGDGKWKEPWRSRKIPVVSWIPILAQ